MTSDDITIVPPESLTPFLEECNSTANIYCDNAHSLEFDEFPNPINSKYYEIFIKHDPTSFFSLFHTNLASINKHFDDMQNPSCLETKFDIIGITEHKIKDHNTPNLNINLSGYHPFIFETSGTNYGGTGFYIKESIVFI